MKRLLNVKLFSLSIGDLIMMAGFTALMMFVVLPRLAEVL